MLSLIFRIISNDFIIHCEERIFLCCKLGMPGRKLSVSILNYRFLLHKLKGGCFFSLRVRISLFRWEDSSHTRALLMPSFLVVLQEQIGKDFLHDISWLLQWYQWGCLWSCTELWRGWNDVRFCQAILLLIRSARLRSRCLRYLNLWVILLCE